VTKPGVITLLTHQYPEQTGDAVHEVVHRAGAEGIEIRVPEEEVRKHHLQDGSEVVVALGGCNRDVCVVERGLEPGAVLARALP
jgi:hypothetical protein